MKGYGEYHKKKAKETDEKIFNMLFEHGYLTWSQLRERTKLSRDGLIRGLKRLEEKGLVKRGCVSDYLLEREAWKLNNALYKRFLHEPKISGIPISFLSEFAKKMLSKKYGSKRFNSILRTYDKKSGHAYSKKFKLLFKKPEEVKRYLAFCDKKKKYDKSKRFYTLTKPQARLVTTK